MKINKSLAFKNENKPVMITLEQESELQMLVVQFPNQTELLEWVNKVYETDNTLAAKATAEISLGALHELPKQQLTDIIVTRRYTVVDTMEDRLAYHEQFIRHELQRCEKEDNPGEWCRLNGMLDILDRVTVEYRRYLNSVGKIDDWFNVHETGGKIILSPLSRSIKVEVDDNDGVITATNAFLTRED